MAFVVGAGAHAALLFTIACAPGPRVSPDSTTGESLDVAENPSVWQRLSRALRLGGADTMPPPYTGSGPNGIPHYAQRSFTAAEQSLLRRVYGIEDPHRLYVSDSTEDGLLKYDTSPKLCRTCYVNSYRIGFVSIRRPGETWEELERRVHSMRAGDFPPSATTASRSTGAMDPSISGDVDRMLADARAAGFDLRVAATYRSPQREAYVMWRGHGRTHTLTSMHSYGRALDVIVGDGNLRHPNTKARWIAFRRWVSHYHDGEFHIIGAPDRTWDWPHVELPSPALGFRTIEQALTRARTCARDGEPTPACDFAPHLPPIK